MSVKNRLPSPGASVYIGSVIFQSKFAGNITGSFEDFTS
jgi:hypothetical protein